MSRGLKRGWLLLRRWIKRWWPLPTTLLVLSFIVHFAKQEDTIFKPYAGAISLFSLALALIFAVDAKHDAIEASEAISTRYIDRFPHNLRGITALVRKASETFIGYADCADYGSFFDPCEFETFLGVVKAAVLEGITVKLLVVGNPQALSHASGDSPEHYWRRYRDELKNNEPFWDALADVLAHVKKLATGGKIACPHNCVPDTETLREFLDCDTLDKDDERLEVLLQCFHEWARVQLVEAGAKVKIKWGASSPEFFFWMADRDEAIFEFLRPNNNALAFTTKDPHLLGTLHRIWDNASNAET